VAWCWACSAVGIALFERTGRIGRWVVAVAIGLLLVVNAALTVRRNTDWRDQLTLWSQTVKVSPNSSRAWAHLSRSLGLAGRREEAVEVMHHAMAIHDGYWEDHMALGDHLARLGRFEEAAEAHLRALQLADRPFKAKPARFLGQCYIELKRPDQAIRAFQVALEIEPNNVTALNNLAYLHATATDPALRDLSAATAYIEEARRLVPQSLIVLDTAVDVYLARGERDRALELIRHGLKIGDKNDIMYAALQRRLAQLTTTTTTTTTRE